MARRPEPWRRASCGGAWYAQVAGRKEWLAPKGATKTEARRALDAVLAAARGGAAPRPAAGLRVRDVIDLFSERVAAEVARDALTEDTAADYARFLKSARQTFGALAAAALEPRHVVAWLDAHPKWGPTSRSHAVTAVKAALNWARKMKHVAANPVADLPRPAAGRRTAELKPGQADAIRAGARDPAFADLLDALRETGCRPGEIYTLTADRVDLAAGTWRVRNKTRRTSGESLRTVYLSDRALALSRRLVALRPGGPLFRNRAGKPWNTQVVASRFHTARRRLGYGKEVCAYAYRHLFVTDALERGVQPATVAELVGHASLNMIMRVYSKLRHRTEHLRDAVRTARPSAAP